MKCPTLSELPPPPPGKSGWPWTEETLLTPEQSTSPMCRISIVSPSYNTGRYLEETIRSILLQGYSDLEYIIIDGGSSDGSVEIIKKYEKWITCWISEPDSGYADAVNKGFARATGDIRAWLPISDLYTPGALQTANHNLIDQTNDFIFGRACSLSQDGKVGELRPLISKKLSHVSLYGRSNPCQPATFWRHEIHKQVGELNSDLRYAADSEWFLRLCLIGRCRGIPDFVCYIRQHEGQLSSDLEAMRSEWYTVWNAVVRKNRISRFKIILGASLLVPLMRYRAGGFRRMLSPPTLESFKHIFRQ